MNAQAMMADPKYRKKLRSRARLKQNLVSYSFILPNFLGFAIFTLAPLVAAMAMSFFNWNGANVVQFNGLDNFKAMFTTDTTFQISLLNTAVFTLGTVPLTMVASLALAILLNQKLPGTKIFRAIFFFPYVASIVAVGAVWNMIFSPQLGPLNQLLISIGIRNPPGWLSDVHWALPTLIFISVWKGMGYNMVLFLAGLQGISPELYEASRIDGATRFQTFMKITLPLLKPTTSMVVTLTMVNTVQLFDQIFVMTNGGPGTSTLTMVQYLYTSAFQNYEMGYGSAIEVAVLVILVILIFLQNRLLKVDEGV